MNFIEIGTASGPTVIFAPGWARTHHDFIPVAESLGSQMRSLLLDLPGFGKTPRPPDGWTTADYADYVAGFIRQHAEGPIVWVGHSFGGRVGLRLAVRHPTLLCGLLLVASAGIRPRRSMLQQIRGNLRQIQFRILRHFAKNEEAVIALEPRFGSPDYVSSRKLNLRDVFLNAVREDQSSDLPRIGTPTMLLYGSKDRETPPDLGRRMAALIPGATFESLPEFDHLSVIYRGRHVIALRIKELVERAPG